MDERWMDAPWWRRLSACDSRQQEKGSFFAVRHELAALMQWLKGKEGEQTLRRGSTEAAGPEVSASSGVAGDSGCRLPLGGGRVAVSISYWAYWHRRLVACQRPR